jgi:hypothetical protein
MTGEEPFEQVMVTWPLLFCRALLAFVTIGSYVPNASVVVEIVQVEVISAVTPRFAVLDVAEAEPAASISPAAAASDDIERRSFMGFSFWFRSAAEDNGAPKSRNRRLSFYLQIVPANSH